MSMRAIEPWGPDPTSVIMLLEDAGIDPKGIYRLEIEEAQVTVYRFQLTPKGRIKLSNGEPVVAEPEVVTLS